MLTSVYNRNGCYVHMMEKIRIEYWKVRIESFNASLPHTRCILWYLIFGAHSSSSSSHHLYAISTTCQFYLRLNFNYIDWAFDHSKLSFWLMEKSKDFKHSHWFSFQLNRCIQTHFIDFYYLLKILWNILRRDWKLSWADWIIESQIGFMLSENR